MNDCIVIAADCVVDGDMFDFYIKVDYNYIVVDCIVIYEYIVIIDVIDNVVDDYIAGDDIALITLVLIT